MKFIKSIWFWFMSDEKYQKLKYFTIFGKKLDLENPKTFNEKIQWLKLYNRKEEYIEMVDKYEAKEYVQNKIGMQYIIPTLGIYDSFEEINFKKLPTKFVMKCTHDCGSVEIIKDKTKIDFKLLKNKFKRSLKQNYYYTSREWLYKYVKPRIIIEEMIEENSEEGLKDYKFFCFNGKVKYFKIDFNRFLEHRANYYNTKMEIQEFGEKFYKPNYNVEFKKPEKLEQMIKLAEILAEGIPFLRVDFYNVNGKIYFGELTFFPGSGFGPFEPAEYDRILGDMLILPEKRIKNEK